MTCHVMWCVRLERSLRPFKKDLGSTSEGIFSVTFVAWSFFCSNKVACASGALPHTHTHTRILLLPFNISKSEETINHFQVHLICWRDLFISELEHIGFSRFPLGTSFVRILDFLLQRFEAANDGMDLREAVRVLLRRSIEPNEMDLRWSHFWDPQSRGILSFGWPEMFPCVFFSKAKCANHCMCNCFCLTRGESNWKQN